MKYISTMLVVKDIEKSKQFYKDVLGLNVVSDFGANVTLEGGIALQTQETWQDFIKNKNIKYAHHSCELYFEEENMDDFINHLKNFDIYYIHEPLKHSWQQRVVRFYDLDKHIIEVGENMTSVIKRFVDRGMSYQQIAKKMDVPLTYVENCLEHVN